jgi:acyl dehydratase
MRMQDVQIGDELPPLARMVTREDVQRYAAVSGDRNPLHRDDGVARRAGYPGIIAHGMFTLGLLGSCVVAWTGDPAGVIRLRAAFRAPVFMGETIVAGGRVRSVDPDAGTATVEGWVTLERAGLVQYAVKKAELWVRLDRPTS